MNQFAIDRAGLTLALLSPLATASCWSARRWARTHRRRPRARCACSSPSSSFPGGAPALWLSLPLALVATYLLVAPGAAMLSAVFPRAVDLNSIGRAATRTASRACSGMLLVRRRRPAGILIVLVTTRARAHAGADADRDARPGAAIALLVSRLLFGAVAVLFDKRRENLGIVAV